MFVSASVRYLLATLIYFRLLTVCNRQLY